MADDIGGVWRTIGGRRVFIKDGQGLSDAMKESGKFKSVKSGNKGKTKVNSDYAKEAVRLKNVIKELDDAKYDDGTYDLDTKKVMNFKSGFQATFQQLNDKYTDEEYGKLVDEYRKKTNGKAYAGKFGGSPEISFYFKNEKDAIEICKKYNQVSYWDWKKYNEDPTYTGTPNKYYKEGKGNDYE